MPKWKNKKNARLQGMFFGSAGVNALAAGMLDGGDKGLLYIAWALLFAAMAVAMDPRESSNSKGAVWGSLAAHLFLTGFVLLVSFHWAVVILCVLELALCIYLWRKK